MRKLLAILFLLVFSFQVLPVKAIGKLLSKGQTEEEVKHSCDSDDDMAAYKYLDLIDHSYSDFTPQKFISVSKMAIWRYDDDLPVAHIADIPSPPPNC